MKLSILMPIYNEIATVQAVIDLVAVALPEIEKELVLVDDGSKDGTRDLPSACSALPRWNATS